MNVLESIIQYIAPHECLRCGSEGYMLCRTCSRELPPPAVAAWPVRGVQVRAVTTYTGVAKQLIHHIKFERAAAGTVDVARSMACVVSNETYDVVTYVPTATSRVRQRGYDQARLIAKRVAHQLCLPCVPLLARTGQQRQVGAGRAVRSQQMMRAFRPVHTAHIHNRRILLIDDVITTGSTISAASSVLYAAGGREVEALVFAAA